jgi:phospholipid/cholesterol/gamma-HCH transport system substrate-binding protein
VNERALEIKVGLLVLLAVAIGVGFVIALGDLSLGRTWPIHVDYGFSGAIHQGAPVRLSGIQVGRVSEVRFLEDGRRDARDRPLFVRLTLDLEERARGVVRTDTEFHIGTAGVLGEAYVDLVPGRMQGTPLEPGATVRGTDPPRTDLLLSRVYSLLDAFGEAIDRDGDLLHDLLGSLAGLARTSDEILAENRETLVRALANADRATEEMAELAAAARLQLADDGDLAGLLLEARRTVTALRRDLPEVITAVRRATETLESIQAVTGELDAEDIARVRATLARYEAAGARLETLAGEVGQIVGRIDRGEGTIGALLHDDQVYDDLRELLHDLREHPWKFLWRR